MLHPGTRALAWTAAILGMLLAVVLFAPARWLALAVQSATEGQVQLANARGTIWSGQADLVFTGGEGSRTQTALPQGLSWRLRPAWRDGGIAAALSLLSPCCTPQPLQMWWRAGFGQSAVDIAAFESRWPAELLTGLGTPWNTLRLEGALALGSEGFRVVLAGGRVGLEGGLRIDALDMASRVASVRPLGSYRATLRAEGDGQSAELQLQTLRGDLQLQGSGQWVGGRLRFNGDAQAAPGSEIALNNLLNIVGRRQGERSVITIG